MSECGVVAWIRCDWTLARPSLEWLLRWSSRNSSWAHLCFEEPGGGVPAMVARWLAGTRAPGVHPEFSDGRIGFASLVNRTLRERPHERYLVAVPPVVGELAPLSEILAEPAIREAGVVGFRGRGFVHCPVDIPRGLDARFVARSLRQLDISDEPGGQGVPARLFDPWLFMVSRAAFELAGPLDCLISDPAFCVADFALRLAYRSRPVRISRNGYFVRPPGTTGDPRTLERDRAVLEARWPGFSGARQATFDESGLVQQSLDATAMTQGPVDGTRSRRIVAVLPTLTPYGGVLSILNLLNHLFELGWEVCLLNLSAAQKTPIPTYYQPQSVTDWSTLPEYRGGPATLVLATSWETVKPALEIQQRSPGARIAHFVQDLEERFYPRRSTQYLGAVASYPLIERKIVKTGYLQHELAKRGFPSRRIPPGMNHDAFFPRGGRQPGNPRVLSMCRVGHPHRGPDLVADCMRRVLRERPGTEIGLFGSDRIAGYVRFPHRDFGLVSPAGLPAIYSQYDVFVELSRQHGFGRTGVEAMACGCVAVLSDSGGVREYARHGENAMLVRVGDSRAAAHAVLSLLESAPTRDRLQAAGLDTVCGYSDRNAAIAFIEAALD